MNIDARPPVVYPTFHDTQRPSTGNKKEVDIDNSVYHLLSLYLNTDAILDTSLLPPLPNKHTPPSWKPKSSTTTRSIRTQRNWFGEDMKKNYHESVLERNTYKNSTMKAHDFDNIGLTKRSRTKSVSFNETVTVILSQDTVSQSKLKQQTEEIFVDALESFE
jgi:hypothetical protein